MKQKLEERSSSRRLNAAAKWSASVNMAKQRTFAEPSPSCAPATFALEAPSAVPLPPQRAPLYWYTCWLPTPNIATRCGRSGYDESAMCFSCSLYSVPGRSVLIQWKRETDSSGMENPSPRLFPSEPSSSNPGTSPHLAQYRPLVAVGRGHSRQHPSSRTGTK